ncbi:MAG: MATE family efflux transporter, partial [Oculatellaceae cyanobacterium Prado106]|nr:MATE family efflux transporter [Oculatellaceae cyanobacterium Prado106]
AATVRVGQWFGQRNWAEIRQAAWVSVGMAIAFTAVMTLILLSRLPQIIGLYLDIDDPVNAEVVGASMVLMTVAAFGQILDGIQRTANGVLQGLQDTRMPMLMGAIAYWGIGLAMSYLLGFHTPLQGAGVWIGYYTGTLGAAIAFVWRFQRLMFKKN